MARRMEVTSVVNATPRLFHHCSTPCQMRVGGPWWRFLTAEPTSMATGRKTSRLPGKDLTPPVSDPRPTAKRLFRYPHIAPQDLDRPFLAREFVRCGRSNCRCRRGLRHGPYWYLRYQQWDCASRTYHYRREYVPPSEVRRVRRWLRRYRAREAYSWAILRVLKRYVSARTVQRAKPASGHLPRRVSWTITKI
jgi:hypothetical protein